MKKNKKEKQKSSKRLRRLRQVIQIIFLAGFIFLLVKALFGRVIGSWVPVVILSVVVILLTLVLGRVWCGWMCPMGTILYWTRFKKVKKKEIAPSSNLLLVKYILIIPIIVIAVLGLLKPAFGWMDRNPLITLIIIISLLAVSILLNLITDLFWCRYLCPLGGAMALISKISLMRRIVRSSCNDCSLCVKKCPMGTIDPEKGYKDTRGECMVCIDCMAICRSNSNGFQFSNPFRK